MGGALKAKGSQDARGRQKAERPGSESTNIRGHQPLTFYCLRHAARRVLYHSSREKLKHGVDFELLKP